MNPINHDDLIKLNERLDEILSSDKALKAAAQSKSSVFRAAAELTRAEHPQVSDAMRERMLGKVLQAVPQAEVKKQPTRVLRPQFKINAWAARVAALVLILLFVGLATPPALASSLPGDTLYPLKRGLENVELAFAGDYVGQVNVHLNQSQRRLDESEGLLAKSRFDSHVMDDALTSLDAAIRIANDHNLFTEHPELEQRAAGTFQKFDQTLADAEAVNLVDTSEVARLEDSQNLVMGYLPSEMADPSSSSEVSTVSAEPTEEATQVSEAATAETSEIVTAEATEVVEGATAYVNADGNVNVRDGAGTAYPIIARLSPNSAVTTLALAGDWTQVRLADGRVGWIANFLLSENPRTVVDPIETSTTGDTTGTTTTDATGSTSTIGTSTSTTSSGTSSSGSSSDCTGAGRSCDAPGHGGGGNGNGNSNGNNNGGSGDD